MTEREQELRDEGDPVPDRHFALVELESLGDRGRDVVQAKQPEDANEQLANLGAFVQTSRLEVAADRIGSDREIRVARTNEQTIVVVAPFGPGFREGHLHAHGLVERLTSLLVQVQPSQEHALRASTSKPHTDAP